MLDKQAEYYENLLAQHGATHKALDWNSAESQRLRYLVLRDIFIYGGKVRDISVLDVGCGLGDLYGFFKEKDLVGRQKMSYTGVDIAPKIIEAAREKYPDAKFELKNILEDRDMQKFDYIFCCGIFNIRTTDLASHMEFVKSMLIRMYDLVNCGLAVNFLSEDLVPVGDLEKEKTGRYYFFKPEEILGICRSLTSRLILRSDYRIGDFTVFLLK